MLATAADQAPQWTDVVTAWASIFAAAGLILVFWQIIESRRSRDAATTADYSRRWDEGPVRTARDKVFHYKTGADLCAKLKELRAAKSPEYYDYLAEPNYFEDLAILCRHRALDRRMVEHGFGTMISERFDTWKPTIEWLREEDPKNYEYFGKLAKEMRDEPTLRYKFRRWLSEKIAP